MGVPWAQQRPRRSWWAFEAALHAALRADGRINTKEWDHNHRPRVPGRSNKEVMIWGALIAGKDVDVVEAWRQVAKMARIPVSRIWRDGRPGLKAA